MLRARDGTFWFCDPKVKKPAKIQGKLINTTPEQGYIYSRSWAAVEVMVHPAFPEEYEPLQSTDWVDALRRLPTGTFANL